MKVSLRDIVLAVRYGDAALVAESSGYLVLGAADLSLDVPRRVSLDGIFLSDDGVLSVDAAPCPFADCERDLRKVLHQLLALVRTPCRNLSRVAERADECGLEHLVRELEAALVPVNRKAARRSLARLARETHRAAAKIAQQAAVEELAQPINETLTPLVGHDAPHLPEPEDVAAAQAPEYAEPEEIEISESELMEATCPPPRAAAVTARAPSPPPPSVRAARATQETEDDRRPTLRFDPQLVAQFASGFGARTPSEIAPVVAAPASYEAAAPNVEVDELDDAPTTLFGGARIVAEHAERAFVDPELQIAVASSAETAFERLVESPNPGPLELSPARPPVVERAPSLPSFIETPPPAFVQAPKPPSSAASKRQLTRRKAPIAPEVSLIPQAQESARRRPSDISELLDRIPVAEQPGDDLYTGLQSLSRVELSPAAPPVAADWMDETG